MPPIEDDKLLDAVSTAVEDARPADAKTTTEETPDDGDEGAAPDTSADNGAPGTGAAADDAQADGDAGTKGKKAPDGKDQAPADPKADRGDGRNAAGEFVKKKDESDADFEKRKTAAPAKGAKPDIDPATGKPRVAAAAKKADHVNDPIPADVKGKTRERMEFLTTTIKSVTAERDTAVTQRDDLLNAIEETGADPDTFGRHMQVLGLMLSPKPENQRQAMTALRAAADKIGMALGETPAGKDPLEGHADLQEELENGDISRDRAIELAKARNKEKADQTRSTSQTAAERQQQELTAATNEARSALNTLGAELAKNDRAFAIKADILKPAVQQFATTLHPSKWLATYKAMYAKLDKITAPKPTTTTTNGDGLQRVPGGTGARQPSRPKQGATGGGAVQEPKSLEEAIDLGIANAARR